MQRTALIVLALALTGCAGGDEALHDRGAQDEQVPLGIVFRDVAYLAELDPLTLAPRRETAVPEPPVGPLALSPDRSVLAIGMETSPRLIFVDRARMRLIASIGLGPSGGVERLMWADGSRMLAFVDQSAQPYVAIVRFGDRRPPTNVSLPGTATASASAPSSIVVLLAPQRGVGQARLAIVDAQGRLQTVPLSGVLAGVDVRGALSRRRPGLAVDPAGRKAVVVPAGDGVAEVDLATLSVSYHRLSEPVSLLGRLRHWLEPAANAKGIAGPVREAAWLGEHLVAVTGLDHDGREPVPAGLRLIDTRDWSVRTVDAHATMLAVWEGTLLAYGGLPQRGTGLLGIGPDGRTRYRLFGDRYVGTVFGDRFVPAVAGGGAFAYVSDDDGVRFEVVDVQTGRVVARPRTELSTLLLGVG